MEGGGRPLRVVLVKPSKYARDGYVERFRRGFMPNSTLGYLASLTPDQVDGRAIELSAIDEYVETDLDYLQKLAGAPGQRTLIALVGVQSHQFQRALDLAALARERGAEGCVIGGPHPMTCDTSCHQGRGVAFALAEAERIWPAILTDAVRGELEPTYGADARWQETLDPPPLRPPSRRELRRYVARLQGIHPARGCPYVCNFCSVIKIAGRSVRSQPVETTLASLRAAKQAGVRLVLFTSDNFNKIPEAAELAEAMIAERIRLPFFIQCDTQIERQEALVELLGRAGCFQMFVGAESFDPAALRAAHKLQNRPERYARIVALCRDNGITSHFSNILGFPGDTLQSIAAHLEALADLDPDVASFYLLTPIPGTEQYAELAAAGLLTEPNLDRYDGTAVTWRHPNLEPEEWESSLYAAYRGFFGARATLRRLRRAAARLPDFRTPAALQAIAGYAVQARLASGQRTHPMAGGIGRVLCDRVDDYLPIRRRHYDCELAPLPKNLELAPADAALNRRAKLRVVG